MGPNCTRAQIFENSMYGPVAFSRRKNLIYTGLKIRLGAGEKNCLKRVFFVLMVRPSGIFCMFDTNTGIPFTPENCIFLVWRIFVTLGIVKREFHALLTCKNGSKNACSPGSAKKKGAIMLYPAILHPPCPFPKLSSIPGFWAS